MRFVSFRYLDNLPHAGVLLGDLVIDLAAAAALAFEDLEGQRWGLLDVLRGAPEGMGIDGAAEIAAAVLDQLGATDLDDLQEQMDSESFVGFGLSGALSIGGLEMLLPRSEVRLLAPLPTPPSLRDFSTFEEHMLATHRLYRQPPPPDWYEFPAFAFGNHTAIYGPEAEIPMPRTSALDYALEVACVIGRAGRDIAEEDAEIYIAGYTIMNNWCARDLLHEELSIGLGPAKGKDFATSLGPTLVTPDELESLLLPDGRYALSMVARVNGVEHSHGNLRDMYHSFAQMIARASRDANLYPGDVLSSGTVGTGCLLEVTAGEGPWLEPEDVVELEVAGLGVLRNRVVS